MSTVPLIRGKYVGILCLLFLVSTAWAGSLLHERKMFDPYIICSGPIPGESAHWPAGLHTRQYETSMQLCSAVNGLNPNVGCICTQSHGEVHCDTAVTDRQLADAQLQSGDSFRDYCEVVCRCGTEDSAAAWRLSEEEAAIRQSRQDTRPQDTGREFHWDSDDSLGVSIPLGNSSCGALNCSSPLDCPSSEIESCGCKATSSTYDPGSGTTAFLTACISSFGGKREDGGPCPCNRTYVSYGCCSAEGGIIHEAADFKLGELF